MTVRAPEIKSMRSTKVIVTGKKRLNSIQYLSNLFSLHPHEYRQIVEPPKRSKGVKSTWRMNHDMLNLSIWSQASQKEQSQAQLSE